MCVASEAADLRLRAAQQLHEAARTIFVHDVLEDAFFVPDETPDEMRDLLEKLEARQ